MEFFEQAPAPAAPSAELIAFLRENGPEGEVSLAAMQGNLMAMKELVANGALALGLPSEAFPDGTALDFAVHYKGPANVSFEMVEWFASLGPDQVGSQTKTDGLGAAAVLGRMDMVKVLAEHGAFVRDNDDYAFRRAAEKGHLELAKWLHTTYGSDVQAKGDYSIGLAAQNGHLEMCQWLVSEGADPTADDDYAMVFAARHGHAEVVQWLLQQGADVSARDNLAVKFAAGNGHLATVQVLIGAGADMEGAVINATEGRHLEVCQWLQASPGGVHPLLAAASSVFLSERRGYPRSLQEVYDSNGVFLRFLSTFRNMDALTLGFDIIDHRDDSSDEEDEDKVPFIWPEVAGDAPLLLYPHLD